MPKRWSAQRDLTPRHVRKTSPSPISRRWHAPIARLFSRTLRGRLKAAQQHARQTKDHKNPRESRMLSQVITEFGKPLQELEAPTPTPTGTEVLLKVHTAGVCHSDVHIHDGYFDLGGGNKLPMANVNLPHTFGLEIEGEVIAVGPDVKDIM